MRQSALFRGGLRSGLVLWLVVATGCGSSGVGAGGDTSPSDARGDGPLTELPAGDLPLADIRDSSGDSWLDMVGDKGVDLPPDLGQIDVGDTGKELPDLVGPDLPDLSDADAQPDLLDVEPDDHTEDWEVQLGDDCPGGGVLLAFDCSSTQGAMCCDGTTLVYCGDQESCPEGVAQCLCGVECAGSDPGLDGETGYCSFVGGDEGLACSAELSFDPSGPGIWCPWYTCEPQCVGKQCGDDRCGGQCGECEEGHFCNGQGVCETTCTPESDSQLCSTAGYECGNGQATDSCGVLRDIDCGGCPAPKTCGGGGEQFKCGCTSLEGAELCAWWNVSCGEVSQADNCDVMRTVECGPACPEACEPVGLRRCVGNALQTCVSSDTLGVWSDELLPCQEDQVCSQGECSGTPNPPDPATIAPERDPLRPYDTYLDNAFLWESGDPVQFGVQEGALQPKRVAVVRGRVLDHEGWPLPGVRVWAPFDAEVGFTVTRADGAYDFVVNGGYNVTLQFQHPQLLTIQRSFRLDWHDQLEIPDVRMTAISPSGTTLELGSGTTPYLVAQGPTEVDEDGERTVVLLFPDTISGSMELPDGSLTPLPDEITVRATEYTVGAGGLEAMPADLPFGVQYTWCGEFTVDEAQQAGALSVHFDEPVIGYLDNFLNLPVGTSVPVGTYSRTDARWRGELDGLVISILSNDGATVTLDLGDGNAALPEALDRLGVTPAELAQLAQLYPAGKSLWRFELTHFTPCDLNLAGFEFERRYRDRTRHSRPDWRWENDLCEDWGCVINPIEQTVNEKVRIVGTPYSLHYSSRRVAERQAPVLVPLAQPDPAYADVVAADAVLHVAGRKEVIQQVPPLSDHVLFSWDGLDRYGRAVNSPVAATVEKTYWFPVGYSVMPNPLAAIPSGTSFGSISVYSDLMETFVDGERTSLLGYSIKHTNDLTLVPGIDTRPLGLGGWSFSEHHTIYPAQRRLLFGTGDEMVPIYAGGGREVSMLKCYKNSPPQLSACYIGGAGVLVHPDGRVWSEQWLRSDDGNLQRMIGGGNEAWVDGMAAYAVSYSNGNQLNTRALHPDGSVYFVKQYANQIWRMAPDSRLWRMAGMEGCTSGCPTAAHGASARDVSISPTRIAVDSYGNFYWNGVGAIWKADMNGLITKLGGDNDTAWIFQDDSRNISEVRIPTVESMAGCPDGSLLFVTSQKISNKWYRYLVRLEQNGDFSRVAGGEEGYALDTVPVSSAGLRYTGRLVCHDDGSIYLSQSAGSSPTGTPNGNSVHVIRDGVIERLVGGLGSPSTLGYAETDGLHSLFAKFYETSDFDVAPDGTIFLSSNTKLWRITEDMSTQGLGAGEISVTSADGVQQYVFDGTTTRHLRTLYTPTSETIYLFSYDGEGRLESVADRTGSATQFLRDEAGNLTSVLSPMGEATTIGLDSNGFLASISGGGKAPYEFQYTPGGLMTRSLFPDGSVHEYEYDDVGRVTDVEAPGPLQVTYGRQESSAFMTVAVQRSNGPGEQHTVAFELGGGSSYEHRRQTETTKQITKNGEYYRSELGDGTLVEAQYTADPGHRSVRYPVWSRVETPQGREGILTMSRSVQRETTGGPVTWHSTSVVLDGGIEATQVHDVVGGTITNTAPSGRVTSYFLDMVGRLQRIEIEGLLPLVVERNEDGFAVALERGIRRIERVVDKVGRTTAHKDALGRWLHTHRDEHGRAHSVEIAPEVFVNLTYDAAGRPENVTMPDGALWHFAYSSTGQLGTLTMPGGATIQRNFIGGRRSETIMPSGRNVTTQRLPDQSFAGHVTQETELALLPGAGCCGPSSATHTMLESGMWQTTATQKDGELLLSVDSTGAAPGSVQFGYGGGMGPVAVSISAGDQLRSYPVGHNEDGDVSSFGPISLDYEGPAGALSGYGDGVARWDYVFDNLGRLAEKRLEVAGAPVFQLTLQVDPAGRLLARSTTLSGATQNWAYAYDEADRLASVEKQGVEVENYAWDDRGNRLTAWRLGGLTDELQFDLRDRVTASTEASVTYNQDGQMVQLGALTLDYATRGELVEASAGATQVQYAYDAFGRLVARASAAGTRQYHYAPYASMWHPAAIVMEDGTTMFLHYDGYGSLYMIDIDTEHFYVATDQVGTPVALFSDTGVLLKSIERDSFGMLVSDSNPSWTLPVGFAGGIEDEFTKLTRFGVRDYLAAHGRFTTLDPLLFQAGQFNLYSYAANSPLTVRDPSGMVCVGGSFFAVFGGGGELCIDSDGLSTCVEGGLGAGSSISLDLFGEHATSDFGVELDASVNFLAAGLEISYNISRCKGQVIDYNYGVPMLGGGDSISYDPLADRWVGASEPRSPDIAEGAKAYHDLKKAAKALKEGNLKGAGKAGIGGSASATGKLCAGLSW